MRAYQGAQRARAGVLERFLEEGPLEPNCEEQTWVDVGIR